MELLAHDLDDGPYGRIVRSKGFFTLASRADVTGLWSQAGGSARFDPAGVRGGLDDPTATAAAQDAQELVFIGIGLDAPALRARLESCLLTPAEMAQGAAAWAAYDDPFPAWAGLGPGEACDDEGCTEEAHEHDADTGGARPEWAGPPPR